MDHAAWWLRTLVPLSPFSSLPTRRNPCLLLSPGKRCVVVIIGCDSGLARLAVGRLEELRLPSVFVYAGCLLAENAQALTVAPTVGFQIDVTKRESVQAAMDFLALKEPEGVYCVVNVAGLMAGGPIEWTNEAVFRYEMNVNYFGLLNVMQTSLPLLKAWGKGARFVTVTSTIAVMPSFPGLSGYAASKAAADTLVNTLRVEVSPWGIDVITVCPGITKTPFLMAAKEQMERAWSSAPDAVKQSYGEEYAAWWARTTQLAITWLALDPHDAVACLLDAVSARWPKTRYFSGLDARLLARPAVHAPDFLWDSGVKALLFLMGQPRPRSAL